jgi:hypothetical protein
MKAAPLLYLVVLILGLAGCATLPTEPKNLSLLKEEILAYVDSGRYAKEVETISTTALNWIERRSSGADAVTSRLAVILDIDETLLSNLPHMRTMDFGYLPGAWSEWVVRGDAPAIEPIRVLYDRALRRGCAVILITGRPERDRVGTEKNLRNVGVTGYSKIFFKPD